MSVVGSFLTIDYRQLFTLKKQSYIHQTAEHQLYFLLLLTAFNRTAYGIEIFMGNKDTKLFILLIAPLMELKYWIRYFT